MPITHDIRFVTVSRRIENYKFRALKDSSKYKITELSEWIDNCRYIFRARISTPTNHRIRDGAKNIYFLSTWFRMRYAWPAKPLMKICAPNHKSDANLTIKTHKTNPKEQNLYAWLSNRLSRLVFGLIERSKVSMLVNVVYFCCCFVFISRAKTKQNEKHNRWHQTIAMATT